MRQIQSRRKIHCVSHSGVSRFCLFQDNEFYFDRHPRSFGAIINFFRTGKLHLGEVGKLQSGSVSCFPAYFHIVPISTDWRGLVSVKSSTCSCSCLLFQQKLLTGRISQLQLWNLQVASNLRNLSNS